MKRAGAAVMLLLAAVLWTGPGVQAAEWVFTHGTSGHVQTPAFYNAFVMGWGLDGSVAPPGTWVHYTVPHQTYVTGALKQWKVRYVVVKFNALSSDVGIKALHVYDGATKIKALESVWWTGAQDRMIDLGALYPITRGLGLSFEVSAGVESMDHRLVFHGVGARWD